MRLYCIQVASLPDPAQLSAWEQGKYLIIKFTSVHVQNKSLVGVKTSLSEYSVTALRIFINLLKSSSIDCLTYACTHHA